MSKNPFLNHHVTIKQIHGHTQNSRTTLLREVSGNMNIAEALGLSDDGKKISNIGFMWQFSRGERICAGL